MPDPRDEVLAAELRALGNDLRLPEPADPRAAVRARLRAAPAHPWWRRWRRWFAAAAAGLVCTVVVVPPARAAVTDAVGSLLRLAGVQVRHGPVPPDMPATAAPLPGSQVVGLDEARRLARFPVRLPAGLGPPDRVTLADPDQTGAPRVVTLSYQGGSVRLDQLDGRPVPGFAKTAPAAEWVDVAGSEAIWLPRAHPVTYIDRSGTPRTATSRLAGPTLVWAAGEVTYRLEGVASLAEARRIAASLQ